MKEAQVVGGRAWHVGEYVFAPRYLGHKGTTKAKGTEEIKELRKELQEIRSLIKVLNEHISSHGAQLLMH